jgi:hypothetical protein
MVDVPNADDPTAGRADVNDVTGTSTSGSGHTLPANHVTKLDLDAIHGDLADVEVALQRLDDGTYWIDEVSGAPLSDDLLIRNPLARRA